MDGSWAMHPLYRLPESLASVGLGFFHEVGVLILRLP